MYEHEQVRAPRVPFDGEALAFVGNRRLPCRAGNLSATGMLLFPTEQTLPGQFLRVVFNLGQEKWIDADAVVVREAREQHAYACGVQFIHIAPHLAAPLGTFIRSLLSDDEHSQGQLARRPVRGGAAAAAETSPIDRLLQDGQVYFSDEATPVRECYRAPDSDRGQHRRRR